MTDKFTAWADIVQRLGIPVIFALVLLWFVVSQVSADIQQVRQDVGALARIESDIANTRQDVSDHRVENGQLLRVLVQLCVNTAPDAAARDRCIP